MKLLTTIALVLSITCTAQKKNIETKSVGLQDFIGFVIDTYPNQTEELRDPQHINFLLQVGEEGYGVEDRILIQQAFKLLSSRLSEDDTITISTYSKMNGIALSQADPKDLKGILFTIDNLKSSIKEFHEDGIALAYEFMEDNFSEEMNHSIVMVRNSNSSSSLVKETSVASKKKAKVKSNAVVLTAIALLPELIAVIKN